ncbi:MULTISPECIES: hypothetical protein [Carboxydothermus]|uniref:Uncharacterized protein n=2 Tax=Carboxydothermus TaxID=129957 RepID=Q3A8Y6_CARHZ|nr:MULTISPECIES: hypothetical protein [Carboxydothermus]ABB14347.1 hypothetical protein CHY_2605 [Carboxydothermus hydrogenoformans Z-2901]NYE57657.1 hypothetical protein [Carboxydothermus ferrireducens DSM 11255]
MAEEKESRGSLIDTLLYLLDLESKRGIDTDKVLLTMLLLNITAVTNLVLHRISPISFQGAVPGPIPPGELTSLLPLLTSLMQSKGGSGGNLNPALMSLLTNFLSQTSEPPKKELPPEKEGKKEDHRK